MKTKGRKTMRKLKRQNSLRNSNAKGHMPKSQEKLIS
jgi:hypothetical protein